jgi:hypothetical protein
MRRRGSLPAGFTVTDLIFDSGTGDLGLRHGSAITWVNPTSPFTPKGANVPISGLSDMRLTGDPSTGRLYGVVDGALHFLTAGIVRPARSCSSTRSRATGPMSGAWTAPSRRCS